jgi:SecD/SecF fusion protein
MSFVVDVDIDQFIINLTKKKYRTQIKSLVENISERKKNDILVYVDEIEKYFSNSNCGFSFVDCFENKNHGITIEKSSNIDVKKYLVEQINSSLAKTFDVVKNRIDKNGTTQPIINRLKGNRKIQIEIPGAQNEQQINDILSNVGALHFWLDSENDVYNTLADTLNNLVDKKNIKNAKGAKLVFNKNFIFDKEDEAFVDGVLARKDIEEILPDNIFICKKLFDHEHEEKKNGKKGNSKGGIKYYFLQTDEEGNPILSGDVISDARPTIDSKGQHAISIKMNALGTKLWGKITGENIGKTMVTTLDNEVLIAANISCKISNGETLVSGNFSEEEVKNISMVLKSGALPIPIQIIERTIVGPELSNSAQKQGLKSVVIAFVLILLFMILFYGGSGFIANIALVFNVIFILAALAQVNSVLTLTGIAGFILTMGMAIDANVLINERIKEELKLGKNIREALRIGYKKASNAIIDSNFTTFLTGVILYFYGNGSTKGFALTLMIGLFFSFFTSVYITRLFFFWREKKKILNSLSFSFLPDSLFKIKTINFVKLRKFAYSFSLLLFLCGCFCFYKTKGFKYGISFIGGYSSIVKIEEKIDSYVLQKYLSDFFKKNISVKEYGVENVLKITMGKETIQDKKTADEQLTTAISDFFKSKQNYNEKNENEKENSNKFSIVSIESVEASMADYIRKNAQIALILVLIVLFFYIFLRFKKWKFGIAAIVSLAHDVLLIFSVYGIAKYFGYIIEVNDVFISAILTIVGYSINSTVIIFDRIRENMICNQNISFIENINSSISSTLRRTLITSFSTIMVIVVIFLFGGFFLEHFSFILLCGLSLGTYSSIFIAAPILADFSRKKK